MVVVLIYFFPPKNHVIFRNVNLSLIMITSEVKDDFRQDKNIFIPKLFYEIEF